MRIFTIIREIFQSIMKGFDLFLVQHGSYVEAAYKPQLHKLKK